MLWCDLRVFASSGETCCGSIETSYVSMYVCSSSTKSTVVGGFSQLLNGMNEIPAAGIKTLLSESIRRHQTSDARLKKQ